LVKGYLNPTGTDGISNLLNPFRKGGKKLPFVQTRTKLATKISQKSMEKLTLQKH
jgi:hypothetical protein